MLMPGSYSGGDSSSKQDTKRIAPDGQSTEIVRRKYPISKSRSGHDSDDPIQSPSGFDDGDLPSSSKNVKHLIAEYEGRGDEGRDGVPPAKKQTPHLDLNAIARNKLAGKPRRELMNTKVRLPPNVR